MKTGLYGIDRAVQLAAKAVVITNRCRHRDIQHLLCCGYYYAGKVIVELIKRRVLRQPAHNRAHGYDLIMTIDELAEQPWFHLRKDF